MTVPNMNHRAGAACRFAISLCVPAMLCGSFETFAQSKVNVPVPMPDPTPYTLHVYADTIQIPTLTLTADRKLIPGLTSESFNISLDAGPTFHPAHVKMEADSPLALGILLDLSGHVDGQNNALRNAVGTFAEQSLLPHDRVSTYGFDCEMVRTLKGVPASADALEKGVDALLLPTKANTDAAPAPHCPSSKRLWDSIAGAVREMANISGYRVLLVVTDGEDFGSKNRWSEVQHFALENAVTVFAIRPMRTMTIESPSANRGGSPRIAMREDPLEILCSTTGGLTFQDKPAAVANEMPHLLELIRNRYVLSFPRPSNQTRGTHAMEVKIAQRNAIVHPAGVGVPLPDPAIRADPSTVPSTNADAPKLGDRRPIASPK